MAVTMEQKKTAGSLSARAAKTGPGKLGWWIGAGMILMAWALAEAWLIAPTERTMGIYQRIFYVHVPGAFTGFLAFFINFIASVIYLFRRSPRADAWAVASAEVGLAFLSINLITGPIWAKPVWGIWWTWDARLTLTLVLWVMYASYLLLRHLTPAGELQPRLAAALAVFFFFDTPIDYMAIRWWRTQHPQPVILGGPNSGMAPAMWVAFWAGWAAFLVWMVVLMRLRYRQARQRQRLDELRRAAALRAS